MVNLEGVEGFIGERGQIADALEALMALAVHLDGKIGAAKEFAKTGVIDGDIIADDSQAFADRFSAAQAAATIVIWFNVR